jgi:hypothetical protein
MVKNSEALISTILEINTFKEIKQRFPIHNFLKKVLTKQIFDMILFAKFKEDVLTIGVHHPTAQFELTNFKPILIQYAKQIDDLKTIKDVKIFRYDKLKPKSLAEIPTHEVSFFEEKSYGIFENNLKDKELFDRIEQIRSLIKTKGQKWK